jgi:site-specific DNA-methyltransferase (adenine-specific)
LDEYDIFVRQNEAIEILRKVTSRGEPSFASNVSSLKPFGLRTNFHGAPKQSAKAPIKLYGSGSVSWISTKDIVTNLDWVGQWKVLIPRATDGNENFPLPIWNQSGPFVSGPGEACTETYLVVALTENEQHSELVVRYMRTKFFRFLVSLRKMTQDNKAESFTFVPDLALEKVWTDPLLYKRYDLRAEEVQFIEAMIRHMDYEDE